MNYSHPKSEVFNEDCMIVMARYPDKFFDLAICDIPYGKNVSKMPFTREVNASVKQKNGNRLRIGKKPYKQKSWDIQPPKQEYFNELTRVSKGQIIFGIEYTDWTGVGKGRIKWDKGFAEGVSFNQYETAYCSLIDYERVIPLLWAGMCQAKSLSEPMTQQGNKKLNEKRSHPCHKPRLLYKRLLIDYGFNGMTCIDTHLGDGEIRMAIDEVYSDYYIVGAENDMDYFLEHEKRYADYKSQFTLEFKTK